MDKAFLTVGDSQALKQVTGLEQTAYLANPQLVNSYSYTANNPLKYVDPSGEFLFLAALVPYAPVALTWIAATGLAVSVPLVGGQIYETSQGNYAAANAYADAAMTSFTATAIQAEALMTLPVVGGVGVGKTANSNINNSRINIQTPIKDVWNLARGGTNINGRWYSEHALERMAPNTIETRAVIESRAIEKGLQRGTEAFNRYVDPRGIPPSVVENAIQIGQRSPGNTQGTWVYSSDSIRVISNDKGGVISVIPK